MASIVLKPGKEKSLLRRHPWIFSGAVAKVEGDPKAGDTVAVKAHDGAFLAQAAFSPNSQIRARVWSFDPQVRIDAAFFAARISEAVARRGPLALVGAVRLVHGESDDLPGLVVDRYAQWLVVQLLATGAEKWRDTIIEALVDATGLAHVYERSDADVRRLEGMAPRAGPLRGGLPDGPVAIDENGMRVLVDIAGGHKTGFYLDQRENRGMVRDLAAAHPGLDALNCFCYTGAFSLALVAGGARSVLSVDSSAPALQLARANLRASNEGASRCEWLEADVFKTLRALRDAGRNFDLVILDPPKFAPTPASLERAARAYKDINLLGFKLLRPGGRLVTFSCSGGVNADLFQKIVAGAALDADIDVLLERRLAAGPDHPVRLAFPEGEYLKGLVLRRRGRQESPGRQA